MASWDQASLEKSSTYARARSRFPHKFTGSERAQCFGLSVCKVWPLHRGDRASGWFLIVGANACVADQHGASSTRWEIERRVSRANAAF
jgi:hypothetical protein